MPGGKSGPNLKNLTELGAVAEYVMEKKTQTLTKKDGDLTENMIEMHKVMIEMDQIQMWLRH